MSRLQVMRLAVITADLLDTPADRIRAWIDDPSTAESLTIGITRTACIPVGHARHRDVLQAAVWRTRTHAIQPLQHVYTLTTWSPPTEPNAGLRVLLVCPTLAALLVTWPIADATLWLWNHLTPEEQSDLLLPRSAIGATHALQGGR